MAHRWRPQNELELEDPDDEVAKFEYLIKWKGKSYLHVQWLPTTKIVGQTMRLKRYLKSKSVELPVPMSAPTTDFFDASYLEIDRILKAWEQWEFVLQSEAMQKQEKAEATRFSGVNATPSPLFMLPSGVPVPAGFPLFQFPDPPYPPPGYVTVKRRRLLVKWCRLGYSDCTVELESDVDDDNKLAEFQRFNHPPQLNSAHPSMFR